MSKSRLTTTAEVADLLGISARQVARRVAGGELEAAMKLPGERGAYLFDRAYIEGIAAREKHQAQGLHQALAATGSEAER